MAEPARTVFIVDDDPSFLKGIERLLRSCGFAARCFESAVDFLANHSPDAVGCVLADLRMPEMDGIALQSHVARSANALPAVFLTGQGDIPTSVEAMRGGAEDFLVKTAAKEAIIAAVERALARDDEERRARMRRQELAQCCDNLTPREREVLFMFTVGLEMRPEKVWAMRRLIFGLGSAQMLVTAAALALYVIVVLQGPWESATILGLAFAISSTTIVRGTLGERGELASEHGRTSFAVLMAQGMWIVPIMALVPVLAHTTGQGPPTPVHELYPELNLYVRVRTLADQNELIAKGIKHAGTGYIESTLARGGMLLKDLGVSEQDDSELVSRLRDDDALIRAAYANG